jgi:N-acyl-phosphatidylethanolamine-hydrolysing phospholipase D
MSHRKLSKPLGSGKPHHTKNGFQNLYPHGKPSFLDFLKWRWRRRSQIVVCGQNYNFMTAQNNAAFLQSNHTQNTLTWIGHATVLLQLDGKNILTDPHFSSYASPLRLAGLRRVIRPGISLEELPKIHMVIISHDHYDSLDTKTLKNLHGLEQGKDAIFYVPLGLKRWFRRRGIRRVTELDWWESHNQGEFKITAVPAQHWSKRSLFFKNKTLWAGWVVQTKAFKFFFAGDTGYSPIFREIGRKLGPFDVSAIPIGAYEPRWFMRHHHISPEEALQIHLDVASKKSVAIHWGTFILTDEPLDEPPQRLKTALKKRQMPDHVFLAIKHGETIIF